MPETSFPPHAHPATLPGKSHVARETFPSPSGLPASSSAAETPQLRQAECRAIRDAAGPQPTTVRELRVRNHPGTMSHITGLFARRAFNLEAIVCVPVGDGCTSRILLLIAADHRLEQVERQLEKLHDVLAVRHRPDLTASYFHSLAPAA